MFLEIDFDQVVERGPRARPKPNPFRSAPRIPRNFGRKAQATRVMRRLPTGRIIPLVGTALLVGELVDHYLEAPHTYTVPANFRLMHTCITRYPPKTTPYNWNRGAHVGTCGTSPGADGTTVYPWGTLPIAENVKTIHLIDWNVGKLTTRWWHRIAGMPDNPNDTGVPGRLPSFIPMLRPMPNPNHQRWQASEFYPDIPYRSLDPRLQPQTRPFEWQSVPPGHPPSPSHVSAPPVGNTKEKKVRSRVARIGVFLWQAFDTVSELAEIVDAFYEALPEEAKDRHDCQSSRLGDSLGQYGIDAADCKAVALWENWDRLNTREALFNVMKNALEDQTIGGVHRILSKLYPPGISLQRTYVTSVVNQLGMEKAVHGFLEDVFAKWGI